MAKCGAPGWKRIASCGCDPKTGHITEYQLPRQTNIRRVVVDNSTTPVTFRAGNNEGASIVKLEPFV